MGDDAGEPKQGRSVANSFVGEGVSFVIGHFNSGVTEPASDVYAENGILMITPGSTNPKITERGLTNVFRTCGRDDQQGKVAGEYIAKNFAGKKIAIAHDKTPYGKARRRDEEDTEWPQRERGSLRGHQFRRARLLGPGLEDQGFGRRSRLLGWRAHRGRQHSAPDAGCRRHRGDDGRRRHRYQRVRSLGGPGTEGTLMTFGPDPQKRPEAQAVLHKFEARNFKPEAYTLYSYAAVQVIAEAAKAINSLDPTKVAAELHSGKPIKTVIGDLAFDKKGDITRLDYVMYTWKKQPDGQISYVEN